MKTLVSILLLFSACMRCNAQLNSNTDSYLSLSLFDSLLKIHGKKLVDQAFPPSINKTKGLAEVSRTHFYGKRNYRITTFKTRTGDLKRERLIFKKNDYGNFQFFYLTLPKYKIGIGYYAYGDKVDNSVNDKIPYIPYPLDAYTIFTENNNRYVVLFDDQNGILPLMNNSIRIFMLDSNLIPQKVIFINESNNNLLYDIKHNRVYSLNQGFKVIYSTDFNSLFEVRKDLPIQNEDIKSLKGMPFFHWRLR